MLRTVELPLWLLILFVAFAAVTFASHFLFPSVRWFFRKRAERVVARLNQRLSRPIEPFKLARRTDMIQRLIFDPQVAEAITEHARDTGVREDVAFQEARKYAREIVPSFSATAYFGFATRLARLISRAFYRVRLEEPNDGSLDQIDPTATVVFVMNHRSNMDYVLVTYLAANRSALSYAVGEWARVWPLGWLIRATGAYFIRRKSGNILYSRVLARYVQMATANGVMQAVFPEGGLSLDGRVRSPKLGLFSYIMADFDPNNGRDVVFVPVALNYDRVLEDRVLVAAASANQRKFRIRIHTVVRYFLMHLVQRLLGRFLRFGYAAVNFGPPLSLKEFMKDRNDDPIKPVAAELMARLRDIVPVLPVPLIATALLQLPDGSSKQQVSDRVQDLLKRLEKRNIKARLPKGEPQFTVDVALGHLNMRGIISQTDDVVRINAADRPLLAFYSNSISHHFDASAA